MPLGVGRGQNVGLREFCHSLTLLPLEASVFHKHMFFFYFRRYIVERIKIRIVLGATNRDIQEASQKVVGIRRIIKYDESYREYGPGDILLFELDQTVSYTPYIQPLCLPNATDMFYKTSECYATGWGWTSPGAGRSGFG